MNKDNLKTPTADMKESADTSTKATRIISDVSKSDVVEEQGMPLYTVVPVEELE